MSAAVVHFSRGRAVIALLSLPLLALAVLAGSGQPAWRRYQARKGYERWERIHPAPFRVFEAAVATVAERTFVFGGFRNEAVQASPEVWAYDAREDRWTRRGDEPEPMTHANAVVREGIVWFAGGFLGDNPGPATDHVRRYDPATDRWMRGPPLPEKRAGGALVLLDGKFHYFGGFGVDRETASGDHWVLDPADSTHAAWRPLAPMPVPRGHLGGFVLDGAIYAVGGCIGHDPYPRDVADVHRYDPVTDRWTAVTPLPEPRSHFEPSSFVRDGRLILIGGRGRPAGREAVDDVTEYDPRLDRWFALTPLPQPRHSPIAFPSSAGIIVGVGGSLGSDPRSPVVWRLRPGAAAWAGAAPLPAALGEVAAGMIGDRVYVVGDGAPWTLAYNVGTGRWDPPDRHAARPAGGNHHAAEVWNGRLYLFGGLDYGQGTVQVYDPAREEWRLGPPMPFAAGSVATALIDGKIYVAGGVVGDSTTRQAARFDPASEQWSSIAPMPLARNHAAAGTDGRRFFVFGGRGPGSGDGNVLANGFAEVQTYDPATDRWTVGDGKQAGGPAPLPQGRGGAGKAVYANGEFWIFGGETLDGPGATRDGVYARVDVYDPATDRWRAAPVMPVPRHGIFPVLVGDRIFIAGGGVKSAHSTSTFADFLLPVVRTP